MHSLLADVMQTNPLLAVTPWGVWQGLWPYLLMLLGFSLIIFVHELGHFAVAKWAGVKVERFAVGFGRELLGFTRGETRYSFNVLPLGGYVKMLGQEDFDDKSKELLFNDDPRSFVNKPVGRRMAVVSAGVVMNVLFAFFVFMIVFMIGLRAVGPSIGFVEPDSPADVAGLLSGDDIKRINGEKIYEFRDVSMAITLSAPHEPIEFIVERNGTVQEPVYVKPDYRRPDNTRDARRQVIGISPGFTREIIWVGPAIDPIRSDQPRVGDIIVAVDGTEVTEANANEVRSSLAYAKEIYVERSDPEDPEAPPQRVRVIIPPELALYPSDSGDKSTIGVLGLTPLVRFDRVDPDGRAFLAGIQRGDTIISWDDVPHPTKTVIDRAVRDCAEQDIFFKVLKPDGRIVTGFVRPKRHRLGAATIQAVVEDAAAGSVAEGEGPRAKFAKVRPGGVAARAGVKPGDEILQCDDLEHPSSRAVEGLIRNNVDKMLSLVVSQVDGTMLRTFVRPIAPGALDASYPLVADDVLQTGEIVPEINGGPSPAALAGIPAGARITHVNGEPVHRWRELIERFRTDAGTEVALTYTDTAGQERVASFPVPRCLRTILGVGPEARILSIAGQDTVRTHTGRGLDVREKVHVGYHEGTRALLTELIGKTQVPVVYRPTPLAEPRTAHVDVTADMVDPWVGRIAFAPNIDVAYETTLLKGSNAFDAVMIGVHKTYYFVLQVYETINRMVFSRSVGAEALSGPLGIVSVGGQIARSGIVEFLFFLGIISANLAVINFLPLPIVDGGLMVFLLIEKIKGSPVSLRVQVATQMVGLFLIIGAFIYVTYNDVIRIWG